MTSPRMTGVRKPDTSYREGRRLVRGILDALSRRVVGYAISRSIDARVAVAALKAPILVKRRQGSLPHGVEGFRKRTPRET
jgi:hypothetical protein